MKAPRSKLPASPRPGPRVIPLPPPRREGGRSALAALWRRKTVRAISPRPLPRQMLSDILWAAAGINRAKKGPFGGAGRTAATASNAQEIRLYVALPRGLYAYEPEAHRLSLVADGDLRPLAISRGQGSGAQAPVRLILTADITKYDTAGYPEPGLHDPETRKSYYYSAAGLMAGNVSLLAAAYGLAAWFHNCDRQGLAKKLRLPATERPLFGLTVGYAAKEGGE
jgi:nitroreductase